jgi:hypothetical protein
VSDLHRLLLAGLSGALRKILYDIERADVIEIEFATGGRMRITGTVDAPTVMALMKALVKGKRLR